MPSYSRTERLQRVALAQQGQPLLATDQIDDLVAYLASLK
jgi:hypothetical protein